jgi:hypothetical protein
LGGPGGPPKSALGARLAWGPKKGPILVLCWFFYPSFAVDRTMSLLLLVFVVCLSHYMNLPLVASRGSAPNWGTGPGSWPWGAPRGGGARWAVVTVGWAATRGPPGGYPPREGPPDPPRGPLGPTETPPGPPPGPHVWRPDGNPGADDGSAPGTPPGGPPRASFGTPSPNWGRSPERRRGELCGGM